MNDLMQFGFQGRMVRVVVRNDEPWWVARDVCDVLEIGNTSMALTRLDEDDISSTEVTDSLGRTQATAIVSESGLYTLVLGSRKPEARQFKRWVTGEVLPSIRKHGMYATDELLENPDFLVEVATRLRDERRARLAAEAQVSALTPKAEFHDQVASSSDCQSIGDVAKLLGTGQNRMFRWLREQHILMPDNRPYQEYLDRGYFRLQEQTWIDRAGEAHLSTKTLVTGRGLIWLQRRYHQAPAAISDGAGAPMMQ